METKRFGGISRDFCCDIPGVPEKFAKKIVFNSRPLQRAMETRRDESQSVLFPEMIKTRDQGALKGDKSKGTNLSGTV